MEDVTENAAYSQRKSYLRRSPDLATNYPVRREYFQTGNAVFLRDVLENHKILLRRKLFLMLNMLGSHDTV